MTTIANDGTTISADGRITSGDQIRTDKNEKIFKIGKVVVACAGTIIDSDALIDIAFNGADIPERSLEANIMTIEDGVTFIHSCVNGQYTCWETETPVSMGSGEMYALSAMDLGKTSKEAVKYAMTRDIYSGGKIKTIKYK